MVRIRRRLIGVPSGAAHLTFVAQVEQSPEPVAVLREVPVVALVEPPHRVEGGRVDVVDGPADGWNASGEEHLAETVRGDAQVVQRAEAPERLPEHAPLLDAEVLTKGLGVLDDRVRPVVREPLGVGCGIGRGALPGAPYGVDRPVPRWSSISTRKSRSARSSHAGAEGRPVGRLASCPGPPWRNSRNGRSRPSGAATSRAKTSMVSPSLRPRSRGSWRTWSVSTNPGILNVWVTRRG